VVQVSGGLIVIAAGWTMLKQPDESDRSEVNRNVQPQDPFRQAFYPLTLPLTVGPGSISVAISWVRTQRTTTNTESICWRFWLR
jgi:multiple antibiotic resistance protein